MLHNFLSRPLSFLDWILQSLLAGLPSNTIKPLQMIQNAAARLVFNEPKRAHVTSLFVSLHWCLHIEQPQAQHPPTSTHYYESTSPPEVWDLLVSDASWCHHREAQNHSPEHSLSPFLAGNDLPTPSGMLDPCQSSSNTENSSLSTLLDYIKKKNELSLFQNLHLLLSFSPSLASLYLFEQCLRLGVIGTSSVCLPLQD